MKVFRYVLQICSQRPIFLKVLKVIRTQPISCHPGNRIFKRENLEKNTFFESKVLKSFTDLS